MRALVAACLLACASGCTVIEDFGAFTFGDGGAGATADLLGAGTPAFGEACTANSCMQYGLRPTMCDTTVGGNTFPGGMCTRNCDPTLTPCTEYTTVGAGAVCSKLDNNSAFCLPRCNVPNAPPCRAQYNCCNGNNVTTGMGVCTPSSFCH
jgi:hypothetical protein